MQSCASHAMPDARRPCDSGVTSGALRESDVDALLLPLEQWLDRVPPAHVCAARDLLCLPSLSQEQESKMIIRSSCLVAEGAGRLHALHHLNPLLLKEGAGKAGERQERSSGVLPFTADLTRVSEYHCAIKARRAFPFHCRVFLRCISCRKLPSLTSFTLSLLPT